MKNWAILFERLNIKLPERPDTSIYDTYRKQLYAELNRINESMAGKLIESNEPKIIVKKKATPYQKTKFKENYTFAFQSLVDGRFSTFIPYSDRERYLITELDKQNGGTFPDPLTISNNYNQYRKHYVNIWQRIYDKYNEIMRDYFVEIENLNQQWKDLYYEYINSYEWKLKRLEILKRDNYKCQYIDCNEENNLQIHHLSYEHVGDEFYDDLITLCKYHHALIHNKL